MKSYIKKIIGCSLFGFIGIFNYDAEARLPKYMAQRAAELLIAKSELFSGGKEAVFKKEGQYERTQDLAKALVNLLYNTANRQKLADDFKKTFKIVRKQAISTNIAVKELKTISDIVIEGLEFDANEKIDGVFVNKRFPCWTGTLTCFMKNTPTHIHLKENKIADWCMESIKHSGVPYKIIGILFTLEVLDSWEDLKSVCKANDPYQDLNVPPFNYEDPYDCVPLPNTAYNIGEYSDGTCLLSSIRNILCLITQNRNFDELNVTEKVKTYLNEFKTESEFVRVAGITNINEQTEWAQVISNIFAQKYPPNPDLKGFVDTLFKMIKDTDNATKDAYEGLKNDLIKYANGVKRVYDESKKKYIWRQTTDIDPDRLSEVLAKIFQNITERNDISIEIDNDPTKTTNAWPALCIKIKDPTKCKITTVATGNIGPGQHIEIIDIESIKN